MMDFGISSKVRLNGYLRRILKVTAAGRSQTLPEQSARASEIERFCDSDHGNERFRFWKIRILRGKSRL